MIAVARAAAAPVSGSCVSGEFAGVGACAATTGWAWAMVPGGPGGSSTATTTDVGGTGGTLTATSTAVGGTGGTSTATMAPSTLPVATVMSGAAGSSACTTVLANPYEKAVSAATGIAHTRHAP